MRLIQHAETAIDLIAALRLAAKHEISAYDAQYVTLAKHLGIPCISEDHELQTKFAGVVIPMAEFVGAPAS